jgi:hypothetical protein
MDAYASTRNIRVTFSKRIDGSSFRANTITTLNDANPDATHPQGHAIGVAGDPREVDPSHQRVNNQVFDIPLQAVPRLGFDLALSSAIIDLWGNPLDTAANQFHLRDHTPPQFVGLVELNNTVSPPGAPVSPVAVQTRVLLVTFDEAIDTTTFNSSRAMDVTITGPGNVKSDILGIDVANTEWPGPLERSFVISFKASPLANATFSLRIEPHLTDAYGNRLVDPITRTFQLLPVIQSGPDPSTWGRLEQLAWDLLTRGMSPIPVDPGIDPRAAGLGIASRDLGTRPSDPPPQAVSPPTSRPLLILADRARTTTTTASVSHDWYFATFTDEMDMRRAGLTDSMMIGRTQRG